MIQTYFTGIRKQIIKELKLANTDIKVAVCWFTCKDLFDLLCKKLKEGKSVELIVLNDSINNRPAALNFQKFIKLGGAFYYSSIDNPMHNKYCIIDSTTLINGSYNWTYYAEFKNFENVMIFKNNQIAENYINDFNRLKSNCKLVSNVASEANTDNQQGTIVENTKLASKSDIIIKNTLVIGEAKKTLIATLGESIHDDVFFPFIPKGSVIPIDKTFCLTTVENNQVSCAIKIRYGEEKVGSANSGIGSFTVNNIPPRPKGMVGLITTFSIDEYGILTVSVKVRETGIVTINKIDINKLLI